MRFMFLFLLLSNYLFSQESKFRILGEQKIDDSLVKQTMEVMIFNNTGHPICLKVSTSFRNKILSSDTIELAPINLGNDCLNYDLWVSKYDHEVQVYDSPRYPLVLNSRTCFVATVNVVRNLKCKDSWIEYSYISQPDIDYTELVNKYEKNQKWDIDPKLKYRSRKIYF